MTRFFHKFRGFLADRSGNATVEFVLVFPVLIWIVFSTFELGWITTRQMMLNRGLNLTIRDLRLGKIALPTHALLKTMVCDNSLILRDCEASIHMELIPMTLAGGVPATPTQCIDRSGTVTPTESFSSGTEEDVMFVRVCVVVDPLMPGMGIGAALTKDTTGGFAMIASSAYKREPG